MVLYSCLHGRLLQCNIVGLFTCTVLYSSLSVIYVLVGELYISRTASYMVTGVFIQWTFNYLPEHGSVTQCRLLSMVPGATCKYRTFDIQPISLPIYNFFPLLYMYNVCVDGYCPAIYYISPCLVCMYFHVQCTCTCILLSLLCIGSCRHWHLVTTIPPPRSGLPHQTRCPHCSPAAQQ